MRDSMPRNRKRPTAVARAGGLVLRGVRGTRGRGLVDIRAGRREVGEGVHTASAGGELARRLEVDMPICVAVDGVLNHFADLDATIEGLLARPYKTEG